MTPNLNMENLLELSEFKKIQNKYKLMSRWCRSTVFLFTNSSAVLFQDLIQEDETDVFLYDRNRIACTANMYGIADHISGFNNVNINELALHYMSEIDFSRLSLVAKRKKESLAFSLALLDIYAGGFLFAPLPASFDKLFNVPVQDCVEEWENCIKI